MRRSLAYGRRRRRGPSRPLVLVVLAVLVGYGYSLWRDRSGGEEEAPALSRNEAEAPKDEGRVAPPVPPDSGERTPTPKPPPERASAPPQEKVDPASVSRRIQEEVARADAAGDEVRLRALLGPLVMDRRQPADLRRVWLRRLEEANRNLVYSQRACPGFFFEKVRRGDTYTHISRRVAKQRKIRVSPGMLEKINRLPARRLRAGQRIKVPEEPLSIVINKGDYLLFVVLGRVPICWYPIGLGKQGSTPAGVFTIGGKAKNPTWTDPRTGRTYRYGEEGHLVGSRWMRFFEDGRSTSLGIHGTVAPESIGRSESDGCIRMHNRNVEELYDLVPEGTPVRVVP